MKHYDEMAADYDSLYADPEHRAQDEAIVGALLPYLNGSVLDVGCGTGLLWDYAANVFTDYLGLDPSEGMLREMLRKHPAAKVIRASFEDYLFLPRRDITVALFGAGSYIRPEHYVALRDSGKHHFVMFYKPGYAPAYDPPEVLKTDYPQMERVFAGLFDWHDFRIATSIPTDLQ